MSRSAAAYQKFTEDEIKHSYAERWRGRHYYTNIAYAQTKEKRNDVPINKTKNTQCSALELLLWHMHYLYTMKITFLINSGDFPL